MHSFDEQKGTRYIRRRVYFFALLSTAVFCLQKSKISFHLFCSEDKGFHQCSLWNEVDFTNIMNFSLSILDKNLNFRKLRLAFVDEKAMITATLESSYHWKTLVSATFLLAKEETWKRVFNTNGELSQNRTEKQTMPFKTTVYWLFTDIWCYLVIDCRGAARNFLEGGSNSNSLKMLATMVAWRRKFWVAEWLNFGPFPIQFHVLYVTCLF